MARPVISISGIHVRRRSLALGLTIHYGGGAIRFHEVRVPWSLLCREDLLLALEKQRRIEMECRTPLVEDQPLPLDWA